MTPALPDLKSGSTLAESAGSMAAQRILGLIVPQKRPVPEEALTMYPAAVKFLVEGVGLQMMTPAGYDSVMDRIVPAALELAKDGAEAIALMGTSLSFYKGAAFNQHLADSIHQATGLPTTTMSTAIVDGLNAVGGRRVAVATAYNQEVSECLRVFLTESGFEVLVVQGLGLDRIGEAGKMKQQDLQKFAGAVFAQAPEADALLVSCGGFRTLEIIAPLEDECKVPVVSSMPHALWAGVRLLGVPCTATGFGTLLSQS